MVEIILRRASGHRLTSIGVYQKIQRAEDEQQHSRVEPRASPTHSYRRFMVAKIYKVLIKTSALRFRVLYLFRKFQKRTELFGSPSLVLWARHAFKHTFVNHPIKLKIWGVLGRVPAPQDVFLAHCIRRSKCDRALRAGPTGPLRRAQRLGRVHAQVSSALPEHRTPSLGSTLSNTHHRRPPGSSMNHLLTMRYLRRPPPRPRS